jgi:hypothetical protein
MDDGTLKPGDVVSIVELIGAWAAAPLPVTQAVQRWPLESSAAAAKSGCWRSHVLGL